MIGEGSIGKEIVNGILIASSEGKLVVSRVCCGMLSWKSRCMARHWLAMKKEEKSVRMECIDLSGDSF